MPAAQLWPVKAEQTRHTAVPAQTQHLLDFKTMDHIEYTTENFWNQDSMITYKNHHNTYLEIIP